MDDLSRDGLTQPISGECLPCYVARMLRTEGCDHTWRWASRFRELRSPDAAGMQRRLSRRGAACDCGIFVSELTLARHQLVRDLDTDELEQPAVAPDCSAVRRTSTHPCANWERIR
ncbi:DUF2695 domain-containing protein [Nocardioides luti]